MNRNFLHDLLPRIKTSDLISNTTCSPRWDLYDQDPSHMFAWVESVCVGGICMRGWAPYDLYNLHMFTWIGSAWSARVSTGRTCMIYLTDLVHNFSISAKKDLDDLDHDLFDISMNRIFRCDILPSIKTLIWYPTLSDPIYAYIYHTSRVSAIIGRSGGEHGAYHGRLGY